MQCQRTAHDVVGHGLAIIPGVRPDEFDLRVAGARLARDLQGRGLRSTASILTETLCLRAQSTIMRGISPDPVARSSIR